MFIDEGDDDERRRYEGQVETQPTECVLIQRKLMKARGRSVGATVEPDIR